MSLAERSQIMNRAARQQELMRSTPSELLSRYTQLAHGVQSGVAWRQGQEAPGYDRDKHMRTGVDITKAEQGGLAMLLVRKGLITHEEYLAALVEGLELEVLTFEDEATTASGVSITFG